MNNTKKQHFIFRVMFGLLCVLAAIILSSCANFNEYKRRVESIQITMNDFSGIPDGTYQGGYDAILVAARVSVTVQNGKITAIDLVEHKNDRGKAAEAIIPRIIEKQTLLVDTISGATNSSRIIQKSVQNALENAVE